MDKPMTSCAVIADFNADNLVGLLAHTPEDPPIRVSGAPYAQVTPVLMDGSHPCWRAMPDAVVVWTRPERVSPEFGRLLDGEVVVTERVLDDVDAFAALIAEAAARTGCLLLPTWVVPTHQRGAGMRDMRDGVGVANLVMRMNLRLADRLASTPNAFLLNTQKWVEAVGPRAFNPKLWYMAKVAFGQEVFQEAVRDIKAALNGLRGQARKLIVLDLDDTLWSGIVGEVGWQQLILGGHDQRGEAFRDFQRALKTLARRGILLGIVSKNEARVAMEAIRQHPEMVLREDDFAGMKINWKDKAQNVSELTAELKLGLQSVVFIDDQPAERARVRDALPEVLVPEWPEDPMLYAKALGALRCFDAPSISEEDRARTTLYATERSRTALRARMKSVDEWIASLGMTVRFETLNDANRTRAAQLLNKTNQMNLSTRRMSETELAAWLAAGPRTLWAVRVSDRFGDAGLTGLLSLEADGRHMRIVDFVLSCRVLGRKVEETMAAAAVNHARAAGAAAVIAEYRPTEKNRPCLSFLERSGFRPVGGQSVFQWDAAQSYAFPSQVTVIGPARSAVGAQDRHP